MPDSFYDVKGNEISKDGIVAQFINNYNGTLTDFNEGSEIRNLIEAFAVYAMGNEERINDLVYIMDIMNADGEYLDLLAGQPQINMERIEGTEATGTVIFSIDTALNEELLVPAGTIVSSVEGLDFETETDNILQPGTTSMECSVRAIDIGKDGNIPAGSILNKPDDDYELIAGMDVNNPDPFTGGMDFEEDNAFRDRILAKLRLQKFGSKPYYIATLRQQYREAHDILFDTSASGYTAKVTPNTYKGTEAQTQLEVDIASYLNNENNKLMHHTFDVVTPGVMDIDIYFQDTVGSSTGIYVKLANYSSTTLDKVESVFNAYLKGGSVSIRAPQEFPGLNLLEEWSESTLVSALSFAFPDVFISFTEKNDAHTFGTGKQKYDWSFHAESES